MSSFDGRTHLYVFDLKNGKKKIAYGLDPKDALEVLAMRLDEEEMDDILKDSFIEVKQRDLQKYVKFLG